jgi:D-glycerate 3-kinase
MPDPMRERLFERLSGAPDRARRVDGYYLPACRWFEARAGERDGRARVALLSGPQGAGKSTLASLVVEALAARGRRAVAVSIDDFYLTHDDQRRLAARYEGNRYLEFRGYPGTHDVALGASVIAALRDDDGRGVRVPVYDKSAHGGRGDRLPESQWRTERGPFDLVLVEGWMLGFAPVPTAALPDPAMAPANGALAAYEAWHSLGDALALLAMEDPRDVVRWRVDAERARRAAGAPGLTDDEARDYVLRFVPAYEAWVPPLLAGGATRGPRWTATLGEDRHPRAIEAR